MMKYILAILVVALMPSIGVAQNDSAEYPAAVISFLDTELPKMERAISSEDRSFFGPSLERWQAFLKSWGYGSGRSGVIDSYPMCTDAITDYLIVGLCRISPPNTICDPATFIPRFEKNLQACRAIAK